MKNSFMSFLCIALLVLAVMPAVSAADLNMSIDRVLINGVKVEGSSGLTGDIPAITAGEKFPVLIRFTANQDAENVEIVAKIRGEDSVTVELQDLDAGETYNERFYMVAPTDLDDEDNKRFDLELEVQTDDGDWEAKCGDGYEISVHKSDEALNIRSIDTSDMRAGSKATVEVLVENSGRNKLDDVYVVVSIEELGISKKVFVGDLYTAEQEEVDDEDESTANVKISLEIPSDAKSGEYEVLVKAYNDDAEVEATEKVSIGGVEETTEVFAPVASKTVGAGEEAVYEIVLVNSGNKIAVYSIIPEASSEATVSVDSPIVAVSAGSSKTVKVTASALSEGTHVFTVNVMSGDEVLDSKVFSLTAKEGATSGPITAEPTTILTIVLAIVFVVLLIILIVLLTKKPEKSEEFSESYY